MPFPKRLARFNRVVTNRITYPVARTLPGFGVVLHTGRRSGRAYRTPVNAFRTATGYVIALTYGADSDWTRNVLAAGGCTLLTRGRAVALRDPRVVRDDGPDAIPAPIRAFLRRADVTEFLELTGPR
ncbi:MAG TPA: nitroreductase family deazaflavin-dependent oxidoreductase [Mycobacteriales bacterium]|nr:nitroreductase family deazaflavin-dependent oxidoreductase [Mycobacteriales bacterium]